MFGSFSVLHALTIFVAAFLVFLIQMVMGKVILPRYGGAPAVWTTCLLFFQIALLAGYGYAHASARWLSRRNQGLVHVTLLISALSLIVFWTMRWGSPVVPPDTWRPAPGEFPVWSILETLGATVGLPFLLISSTSPLLQHWLQAVSRGNNPYRLYVVSNIGSLLGLISYPFLIERFSSVATQGYIWGGLFLVFASLCSVCALRQFKNHVEQSPAPSISEARPAVFQMIAWLLLATSTSTMLLAVTNQLCQDVAVVPLLWMLPLVIYLLTFIIAFDHPRWYSRRIFIYALVLTTSIALVTAFHGVKLGVATQITSYGAFLFVFCMTCHGEMFRLRPAPAFLTRYYLIIASGGALGGIFTGILAPILFNDFWEFHIALTLGWLLLIVILAKDKTSFFFTGDRIAFIFSIALPCYLVVRFTSLLLPKYIPALLRESLWISALTAFLIGGIALFLFRSSRVVTVRFWPRFLLAAILFLAECFAVHRVNSTHSNLTVAAGRNFYGALRVSVHPTIPGQSPGFRELVHGRISHGSQYFDEALSQIPVSYYAEGSGVYVAIQNHPHTRSGEPLRIGVVGLGTGTMAAYARPGDTVVFYEINPLVADYAIGENALFSYLKDSKGTCEIHMGDARIQMEAQLAETGSQKFDILVLDAFSSDAIPVHLMTLEAFHLYIRHLRDADSVIAVNISNRFLDFRDLVTNIGSRHQLETRIVQQNELKDVRIPSTWAILQQRLGEPGHESTTDTLWTDSFSNLLDILR